MNNLLKVIEKSKRHMIEIIERQEKKRDLSMELNICEDVLPVEYFMNIPNRMKFHKFYQDVKIGDLVIGSISRIYQNRIEAVLICTAGTFMRDIDDLKITAICRANELPVVSNFSSIKAFQCGDKIKAIITKITRYESLEISMNEKSLITKLQHDNLGLISDENLPSYFKIFQGLSDTRHYFNELFPPNELSTSIEIKNKLDYYNIDNNGFSLLDDVNRINIPECETTKNMRNSLLLKESMKYVVKGVNYYKMKQLSEAMQCYNHALSINEANVDALVARGALRASSRSFELSIEDLEKAVKIDPNHKNAALYLSQTIVAYSKSLPENDRSLAENLVKTTYLVKDEDHCKKIINDIKDPNQFIIVTDDDINDGSDSSKSVKKRKNKRVKKHKLKTSKKMVSVHSSSSEDRKRSIKRYIISDDSSSDSNYHNRTAMSSIESHKQRHKHSKDSHKQTRKRRHSSSSDSSAHKKSQEKSVNRPKKIVDTVSSEHRKSVTKGDVSQTLCNLSASSSHKGRSKSNSSSDGPHRINNNRGRIEYQLPRYLTKSFKDSIDTRSWNFDKVKVVENNGHVTSHTIEKDQNNHDTKKSTIPDIIVSCDHENLKLKKANEDIKEIEDFISTLRQSVPL